MPVWLVALKVCTPAIVVPVITAVVAFWSHVWGTTKDIEVLLGKSRFADPLGRVPEKLQYALASDSEEAPQWAIPNIIR